jgi:hypothetical protein
MIFCREVLHVRTVQNSANNLFPNGIMKFTVVQEIPIFRLDLQRLSFEFVISFSTYILDLELGFG